MDENSRELFRLPNEEEGESGESRQFTPLAERMRPRSLEEFVGQAHILGENGVLRRMIESDRLASMIFWGPPGSGKTTLARIIARRTGSEFLHYSAVTCGVKEIKAAVKSARERLRLHRRRTIVFLDEIHRFNKAQQDALLPHVESGTITLIGATTENPSFEVNSALLSRVRVFVLHRLEKEHLERIIDRALADSERGLGETGPELTGEARELLLQAADGDARTALTGLELAVLYLQESGAGRTVIDREVITEALQQRLIQYDRQGEQHYDVISAFIKSMRGSDPDAALYYLARMLEAGEDPLFIMRRMLIFASEDIGNADPQALQVASAAHHAVSVVGLPEAAIIMSHATTYLSTAPKSNASYLALRKAQKSAREHMSEPVPLHLRNAPTQLMKTLGYAEGYKYAHDFPYHFAVQRHLPEKLAGARFYEPGELGFEREIRKRLDFWKKLAEQRKSENSEAEDKQPE